MSDDGRHGLTIIAFLGSVFSPYYAWARRRAGAAGADPLDHVALNVSLYGPRGKRWCMTERGRHHLQRDATTLQIGPSALRWDGDALTITIDEITVPWPSRLRGEVRLRPSALCSGAGYALDAGDHHHWRPVAASARVEIDMRQPAGLHWQGTGYFDCNAGDEPLEQAFRDWHWSRAHLPGARTAVLYDVNERSGSARSLALQIDAHGRPTDFAAPPAARLPPTAWRLPRTTRSDPSSAATIASTLEDAPFYARSLLAAQWQGERVMAMHESLSLDRFDRASTRCMLPFRMPRVSGPARS